MPIDHTPRSRSTVRWSRYLQGLSLLLAAVSLVLPLLPAIGAGAFSLLVYQDTSYPDDFSDEAVSYIRLTNAVLGSVMAGWFVTMFVVARHLATVPRLWRAIGAGLAVWFVPDTAYSLVSGYWENAVLNLVLLAAFAPAIASLARHDRSDDRSLPGTLAAASAAPGRPD